MSTGTVRSRRVRLTCLAHPFFVLATASVAAAQQPAVLPGALRPGDVLTFVGDNRGTLVKVDPLTGEQTPLSDFGDPSQGPTSGRGLYPFRGASVVVEDAATVFVFHPFASPSFKGPLGPAGVLFRVDPMSGARTIISDFGDPSQGPVSPSSGYFAIESSGDFLSLSGSVLLRTDRATGVRTIVSDFADPAQGPEPVEARGLTIESSGHLVVGDTTEAGPSLFRVDPSNGARTVLTEFEESRESFANLNDVATDFAGNILVIGYAAQSFRSLGRLFRVDAATGAYVLVAERPCGSSVAMNMAVEDTGNIIMIVGDDTAQRLARFDPGAGACTRVFLAGWISDVAVVPTPSVNDAVSLSVAGTVLDAVGAPHAPAGVFRIAATFTNLTSLAIRNPFFRVAELSGGNLLVSGDRPPDQGMAGKGARQTPDVGLDGLLSPGESIVVEFGIGLQSRQAFTFLVDVFGEIDSSGSK